MAGGRADTRELCRVCGASTMYSVYRRDSGMLVRRVICPECQGTEGIIRTHRPPKCPSCKGRLEYSLDGTRAYCNNKHCHAMILTT